jgi:RimJ/RimL family protein N-acetyltransferase
MQQNKATIEMFPRMVTLQNGRSCTLRHVTEDDAQEILTFLPITHIETDFVNYLPGEFKMTLEEEKEFIRKHTGKRGAIALCAVVDGRIVALGGAEPAPHGRFSHQTEVGLVVRKEFWHLGIGRAMMDALIEWGRHIGLHKMCLRTFADNVRAHTLYVRLGFVEEGRLRDDRQRRDGSFGDTIVMALFFDGRRSAKPESD